MRSISFEGTSNSNLEVLDNPAYKNGNTIRSMDELIRQTPAFNEIYRAPTVPEEDMEEYWNGNYKGTGLAPKIVLIQGTQINNDDETTTTLSTNKGLVGTVLTAYNTHQNLHLRPDDIWMTILAQFSAYVNGRSEELRYKIVSFEGQRELEVITGGSIFSVGFDEVAPKFLDLISENINDPTLREWFLPGFSTSTQGDDMNAAAMAMCTLQAYFAYKWGLVCGIPKITLLGTIDDWIILRSKVDRLLEFDDSEQTMSTIWVPILQVIADNFVESAKNGSKNNMAFWDSIISHERTPDGCTERIDLTGWLSAFTIFNEEGEVYADVEKGLWPQLPLADIQHNVATCPVSIDDNGVKYNSTLFVGQMAYDFVVDEESTANPPKAVGQIATTDGKMRILVPRNDWALTITKDFQEVPLVDPYGDEGVGQDGTVPYGIIEECPSKLYTSSKISDPSKQPRLAWIIPVVVTAALFLLWFAYRVVRPKLHPDSTVEAGGTLKKGEETKEGSPVFSASNKKDEEQQEEEEEAASDEAVES